MLQSPGTIASTITPFESSVATPTAQIATGARSIKRWEPAAIFAVTLAVLALLAPRITTYLNPVEGDEPFYLMTAISLLYDHDINECNNYRQQDELALYPSFYEPWTGFPQGWLGWTGAPFPLPPHPAHLVPATRECAGTDPSIPLPANGTGNELYSKHGLGLSLLVLPAFALGGRDLTVYFLILLGALLAANVYLFARESTDSIWPAVLTWAAFAFTIPQLPYSFLIFPELPAALLVIYAFRRIRNWDNNWAQVGAIGACMAFLPWLHYRFIPVSAALFIYYIYMSRKRPASMRWANYGLVLAEAGVSAVLLMAFFYQRYHSILPDAADHAGSSDVAGTLRGVAGSFLDVQWGLFVAAPVYILAFVGVILMLASRRWRGDLLWIALVFVPYFLVVANYAQWWGEWCPPARYLASVLPLLAMPFALTLERIRSVAYGLIYGLLTALSLLVSFGAMFQPQWMYNQPDANSQIITKGLPVLLSDMPAAIRNSINPMGINNFFPSFVRPYFAYLQLGPKQGDLWSAIEWKTSVGPALIVAGIILLCLGLAYFSHRREARLTVAGEEQPGISTVAPGLIATADSRRAQLPASYTQESLSQPGDIATRENTETAEETAHFQPYNSPS